MSKIKDSGTDGTDQINGLTGNDLIDGRGGYDEIDGGTGNSEAGVSFDRTASVKRLPNGIRDVRHEPRMATLTSRAVINAFSVPLTKTPNSPFHGRLGAKVPQSARHDCTLLIGAKVSQKYAPYTCANDNQYLRTA